MTSIAIDRPDVQRSHPRRTALSVTRGLVRSARPKQWVKSVLVLAAPLAAGTLLQPAVLWRTAVGTVALTLCAAAGYLVNDASDVEADRRHPSKQFRPIAAGVVPVWLAYACAVALVLVALVAGGLLCGPLLSGSLAAYTVTTVVYSRWLKHVAIVEMLTVALCFLLRPIAGAAASGVPLSKWFLIVASFGSLYMVAGKRFAEVDVLGEGAAGHRKILDAYPAAYLRQTRELAAGVTVLAYCLWAFERNGALAQVSIIPVTYGLLRYALLLERGQGGAPEDVVLHDRGLLLAGMLWVVIFGAATAGSVL